VVRCLALADELHTNHDVAVSFAMRPTLLGAQLVQRRAYPILVPPDSAILNQEAWLSDCILKSEAQILIADVRDDLSRATLDALAKKGTVIVLLDDLSDRRLAADFVFYPPVPQLERVSWSGFRGKLCIGWEWIVLRLQFADSAAPRDKSKFSLLIAMGGSDPAGLTLKAVRALDRLDEEFESVIIVGAGFCHGQALRELLGRTRRRFAVREDVSEMSAAMSEVSVAICSFGMTAYELAAMGVPSVYICLTDDHARSASALAAAGMGISVGVNAQDVETRLGRAAERLLVDKNVRTQMSLRASELVDGRGASRIAKLLVSSRAARSSQR
jgi:spore coat polysaccharide biosynthesis predicted glycosyltransferase SpsG